MKDNENDEQEDRVFFKLLSELRKEKLFITYEKSNIQKLNKSIKKKTELLIESTWITVKQRLYLLNQREFTVQNYEHIKAITDPEFVEAKTLLGFQTAVKIENLLQTLRSHPEQLAQWLFLGEDAMSHNTILQSIVTGLYSSCLFSQDTKYMLKLLLELAKLQLIKSDNPRRMLKQGTCSFKNLYFIFTEVLPPAKFFLSAVLELPILRLAAWREFYLDLDPDKTLMRYRQNENNIKSEFRDVQEYRNEVTRKLVEFTNFFLCSLRENVYSFPKSIAWVVYQISKIINKSFGSKEANAIVTELVFTLYICPAIVDPEQYCICDAQITPVTQHNLIQIGQILQILALNKFEAPDGKFGDVYGLLDGDVVGNFLEDVLFDLEREDEPPGDVTPGVFRDLALFAADELNNLIMFLQKVYNELILNDNIKKHLGGQSIEAQVASLTLPSSLENSPKTAKPYTNGFSDTNLKRSNFLSLVARNHSSKSKEDAPEDRLTVLIFSLDKELPEPVGFLSEDKFLSTLPKKEVILKQEIPESVNGRVEEKSSYSNFPIDEGSIGNTSDNLEAISEAASNHSVASSLELENEDQNDNLSDMISANVSGRGTPNISGRDTPSSQVNEEERPPPQVEQPQPQISRQIRSEIDDKFCKFEIKKLLEGDETISIISETWSTDVLASDNETVDAGDARPGLHLVDQLGNVSEVPTLDISETQSESAWSTDVMTSDTERLTEVENDDAGSVAQSDDTNSVARSDDTRSETDENTPANRRLSNSSNPYINQVNYLNYQEYRKVEIKNEVKTDNNANNVVFKSHNIAFSELKSTYNSTTRPKHLAGPSGFSSNTQEPNCNFDDRPNEILLSNCSLNSSSSGSSSNSFENKHSTENCERWESKQWLNSSGSSLNVTSTPSESTSELSVLSVSNLNNPVLAKKSTVLNGRNLKPSASTGAIPKSISFDMSADKGDKYLDDDQRSKRGGFFGKLRMGFKNRRGKSFRNQDDFDEFKKTPESAMKINNSEASEDILAKYRTKPFLDSSSPMKTPNKPKVRSADTDITDSNMDINNSYDDIKKKLRLVLSNTTSHTPKVKEKRLSVKSKVETILRLELGKARKLKEWPNIARISETLRFVNLLNESTCINLLQSLQEDYLQRAVYVDYLIYSRQELLFCHSYLEGLSEQVNNEKEQCEKYLSTICVRKFLLDEEDRIGRFCEEFKDISLSDEKCDYLNNFYKQLHTVMQRSLLWQDVFKNRGDIIKITLERWIMGKIYKHALYPNGDGDRHRDHVLNQHIEKLSSIISPDHKDLMIHKIFLREMPWLPAQDALKAMNAYRTPRDKVSCVVQCAKCIMDLLSFSQNAGSTTADDFTPVLVYVIIRVNPTDLLSTIQFVNSFYQNQIRGEELYWWTQFCSAVEYIKTMDYSD